MSGSISVVRNERETIIQVGGNFGFSMYAKFRDAYRRDVESKQKGFRFVVDLSKTDYIDSSALGMLIVLREEAGTCGEQVEIARAHPGVRRVLEEACLHRLFNIT
jgi:anti-anti-sigma factor